MGVGRSSLEMIISSTVWKYRHIGNQKTRGLVWALPHISNDLGHVTHFWALTSPPLKHLARLSYKATGRDKNLTNVPNVCHQVHPVDIFGVLSIRDESKNVQEERPGIYFRQVQHLWPSHRRCLWLQ